MTAKMNKKGGCDTEEKLREKMAARMKGEAKGKSKGEVERRNGGKKAQGQSLTTVRVG